MGEETVLRLPELNYAALAPMLILFGAACLGVLVEAFVPRRFRNAVQLVLSLLALVAALFAVVMRAKGVSADNAQTAVGAVSIDTAGLFLQGSILVLGIVSMLLLGERTLENGGPFVAQAAITVGSELDRRQAAKEPGATEVYPLVLFAIGGMMLFVTANDLLVMFIALEVFSLPLYLLCALARRKRLLSQEAALKYFLLGAYASAFFLFGLAMIYGYAGAVDFRDHPHRHRRVVERRRAAAHRPGDALHRPALQGRGRAVPRVDARRLPGRADADHRVHGGLHQGRRVRRAGPRAVRRVRPGRRGTTPPCWVSSRC